MDIDDDVTGLRAAVVAARRQVAADQALLVSRCVQYADARAATDRRDAEGGRAGPGRSRPGEFVADELSLLLREQPYAVRCLVARGRRVAASLPTVWEAFATGEVDAEQVRMVDKIARRAVEAATVHAIDTRAVDAAQTRSPKQLGAWLLRLLVEHEPTAFEQRHRRALADRGVRVLQGPDGIGYVTGEVSAADAATIDARLDLAARTIGTDDPRTMQQRRSDLYADLLLGRLLIEQDAEHPASQPGPPGDSTWVEVEDVDPDTGELLGTHLEQVDADGAPVDEGQAASEVESTNRLPAGAARLHLAGSASRRLRVGVVVPLSSLLGLDETPGQLPDRSALVPGEVLRRVIAESLDDESGHGDEVLFTRLLTDDGGRLLDTTELGRHPSRRLAEAIGLRAGTCRFPTCTVAADRCDIDHHEPVPRGETSGRNTDPACRRHHRAKTHAWLATRREEDTVYWTMPDADRYACVDDPLPVGAAA